MLSTLRLTSVFCLFIIGLLGLTSQAHAQVSREEFGKNRIQYKYFNWQYYETNNFQVYYYDGGENLAKKTIEFLESEFSRVTEIVGYFPYSKIRIFLYNSIADKQQSNVGLKAQDFSVGGQTNFVKSQVEVAYSGDFTSFNDKLIFSVSEMLIEEMLFGGNIAEMFQSSFSSPIPVWFTRGISSYVAYGWSKDSDDVARELISSKEGQEIKFNKFNKETNTLLGESIWNFIVQRYGQRSVSNILNLARIIRDEEASIAKTLGVPFGQFLKEWRAFYTQQNQAILQSYVTPPDDKVISTQLSRMEQIGHVKFNREGTFLAYSVMDMGKIEVRVINLENKQEKVIYKKGLKLLDQEVNYNYPLLSWVDEFTLGIVSNEYGRNMVTIKRLGSRGEQVLYIPTVAQIQSFEFKEGGRLAVLTGSLNGVSDAYLFQVNRGVVRRISNDNFDDRDISFMPESNVVVFTSNRPTDSVYVAGPSEMKDANVNQFNLFTYDLDVVDSTFDKLTNALAVESQPMGGGDGYIYFLSDQQGINNLYRYHQRDSVSNQLSNYNVGMKSFSLDLKNNQIAFVSLKEGHDVIYLESMAYLQQAFTPVTPRRAQETAKILAEIRRKRLIKEGVVDTAKVQPIEQTTIKAQELDSLKEGAINTENYVFKNESKVDSKDYKFETEESQAPQQQQSFLSIYQNRNVENALQGPLAYAPKFQTDNVVTSFVIDEIRSFSQLIEVQMNDLLENHRFKGGVLVPYNFSSGFDAFLQYDYLKERIDLHTKYYRKSIVRQSNNGSGDAQRYNLNRFEVGAAVAGTPNFRIELSPFFSQTRYIDSNPVLIVNPTPGAIAEKAANYAGFNASLVYDNSIVGGTNIHEGTRAKLSYESHIKLSQYAESFNNLELDVRHYFRVSTGVYLAGRFFYGRYAGNSPKRYLLGGVDNWVLNKTNSSPGDDNPLRFQTLYDNSDILFNQFTNLRGYDYNTFRGRNTMTFSAELRLPVNQFLASGNTKSNFVKNLQFLGFYDIGSAWDDLSPFNRQNNLNTEEIQPDGSPFKAVINNFSNPWLQSLGVGTRTMLFGFFSRIDVVWPIRDYEFQNPRLQLSIGHDF